MTEREKLIKELKYTLWQGFDKLPCEDIYIEEVADFILTDRKRIVAPLLEPHTIHKDNELEVCKRAIKAILSLAGIGEKEEE